MKKEVYNDGVFIGSIVSCSCGAEYRCSEVIIDNEDGDNSIQGRDKKCPFCGKFLGEFDGFINVRRPSRFIFLFIRMIRERRRIVKIFYGMICWYFKSMPIIARYRKERVIEWMKGLIMLGSSSISQLIKRLRQLIGKEKKEL